MKQDYWDDIGAEYADQILNVYAHDKQKTIKRFLTEYTADRSVVGDFGCGIGNGLSLLSKMADRVFAVDFSECLLEQARRRSKRYKNVEISQCDLAKGRPKVEQLPCIVSVNVLITDDAKIRSAILRNIHKALKKGGTLILVTPSLESQIWSYHRFFQTQLSQQKQRRVATRKTEKITNQELFHLTDGIICLAGTNTKFHLGPELDYLLNETGFRVLRRDRIGYAWHEELMPEQDSKVPKPWNWIVAAKKK